MQTIIPDYIFDNIVSKGTKKQVKKAEKTLLISQEIRSTRHITEQTVTAATKQRVVYDAENSSTLPGIEVRSEGDPASTDDAVNEAYDGAGITTDYYFDVHNRDSIDNNGLPLLSVVHFLQGYDNAFWNGSLMVYGDGDEDLPKTQRIFNRFTLLDICAHELSHAVNQYEAALVYQDQSGALSESFSDVFAVLVTQKKLNQTAEQADWLIAKDLFTNNVNATALRSMKNPGSAYDDPLIGKDPQLGHMNDYNNTTSDYGGVHINSGIPNKAFYECAIRIGGPAWNNPADIWYKTWTEKLGPNSTFQNCADFTYTAAEELFGKNSNSHKAVKDGWAAVGINVSEKKGCNIFARIAQIFK